VNLPSVITDFADGATYVVRRAGSGSYVDGIFVPAVETTSSIEAFVQPMSGQDLLQLPEGHHADEVRLVMTATELRSLDQDSARAADIVEIDGVDWRVVEVARWDFDGDTHYEVIVSRRPAA
jgi:hypothetical protein